MTILEFIGLGEGVTAARNWLAKKREEPGQLPPIDFRFLIQRDTASRKPGTKIGKRKRPQEVRCANTV
jgi:hypothetical protein